MTTAEREETEQENNLSPLVNGEQELAALHVRIAPHFRRAEVRERARLIDETGFVKKGKKSVGVARQ
jgi:SRSO17 transposase